MDYSLENLGPERFQELCHALLSKAFPKTQCFPVGQPDGGRDALSAYSKQPLDKFVVYQVKFTRRPLAKPDPHKWLIEQVTSEAPKVQKLIPKGAAEYYLLTNVPGTAHLSSGSIDEVQKLLSKHFNIPAQCWWRDDINRRLDDAWDIKWSYPDILSGPDILRFIVQTSLSKAEGRTSVIRAFLRDQSRKILSVSILAGAVWLWSLYCTDCGFSFLVILGAGLLLRWISLKADVNVTSRTKRMLGKFGKRLAPGVESKAIVLIGLTLIFLPSMFGSIRLEAVDERTRTVRISSPLHPGPTGPAILGQLPNHGTWSRPLWATWLGRQYDVKVTGLPKVRIDVQPFSLRKLIVPHSFTHRPVMLIRPTRRMSDNAEAAKPAFKLEICRDGELVGEIDRERYRGETVWVGCGQDVEIPEEIRERWTRQMLGKARHEAVLQRWNTPLAAAESLQLHPGNVLTARLLHPDGSPYAIGTETVSAVVPGAGFVQELILQYATKEHVRPRPMEGACSDAASNNE